MVIMSYMKNSRANVTKASGAPAAASDLLPPVLISAAWNVGRGGKGPYFCGHEIYNRNEKKKTMLPDAGDDGLRPADDHSRARRYGRAYR